MNLRTKIARFWHPGSRDEHIGPVHDDAELKVLGAVTRQRRQPVRASPASAWARIIEPVSKARQLRVLKEAVRLFDLVAGVTVAASPLGPWGNRGS